MIARTEGTPNQRILHGLVQAAWGACWGVFVASLGIALLIKYAPTGNSVHEQVFHYGSHTTEYPVSNIDQLEQVWYLLLCLTAPLLAFAALRVPPRVRLGPTLLSCAACLPLLTESMWATLMCGRLSKTWLGLTALALTLPLLWRKQESAANPSSITPEPATPETTGPRLRFWPGLAGCLAVLGAFALFCWPVSLGEVADSLTPELHIGSFALGPSLYYHQSGLVPGLDFESHYGIGFPYLVALAPGGDLHSAMTVYFWIFLIALAFYYLTGFLVLADFFRSYGAGLTALLVVMFFSLDGNHYLWPSNWPVRFPFLFLFLWCAARETLLGRQWLAVAAAGACGGLSLFWQTDVGLYMALGGTVSYLAWSVLGKKAWWLAPLFLLALGTSFLSINLLLFGPRVLSPVFFVRLLEPLSLYSSGFGSYPMSWAHDWRYVYNLLGFMLPAGALGWCLNQFLRHRERATPPAVRFLFLAGVLGLLMIFKWVNRSLDTVWSFNAPLLLVLAFYWVRQAALALQERLQGVGNPLDVVQAASLQTAASEPPAPRSRTVSQPVFASWLLARGIVVGGVVGLALLGEWAASEEDLSSPLSRFQKYHAGLPNVFNGWRGEEFGPPSGSPLEAIDVAFIRRHTRPGERVAVVSPQDWLYLVAADRAPHFHYVHVVHTHSTVLLRRVLADLDRAELVFLDRSFVPRFLKDYPGLAAELMPRLEGSYEEVDAAGRLVLLRRKAAAPSACR